MGGRPMGPWIGTMRRLAIFAFAPLLLFPTAAAAAAPATGRFLALSDIHFDPFADPAIVPKLIAAPAE